MIVILGFGTLVSINNVVRSEEYIASETIEEMRAVSEIRTSYMSAKSSIRETMILGHNHTEPKFDIDRVSVATDRLLGIGERPDQQQESELGEREIAKKIHQSWQELRMKYNEILESASEEAPAENTTILLGEAETMEEPFESMVNQRLATESEELEERREILLELGKSSTNVFYLQATLAVIGSITIGAFISRSITKPIYMLMHATRKISDGNFNVRLHVQKGDEIGELSKEFDKMKEQVRLTNENLNTIVKSRTKELELANEELKRKDRIKDEFISVASHELKTPVHPILELAEAAKEGLIGHEEAWELVFKHAKRLQRLTNDILDVSRIETGQLTYRFEKVPINQIIRNMIGQILVNVNKDLQIELNLDKEIEIDGDKDRLVQVFVNVIENARKFTKRGKVKVESRVFAETNVIEIRVSDTGTGIPSDILPEIFGKFVTRGESGGTGLGLFISKAIVNAHGGKISAQNNEEGGATIIIILPITRKEESSGTKP
jgi:signal transduction histidine kinase